MNTSHSADASARLIPAGEGRLASKVVFVSGAGSVGPGWGNGRAVSVLFAQEGATVFGVDCDVVRMDETAQRIAALKGHFTSAACDATDSASIAAAVADCVARFGRIDVLVNNVGGSARGGPIEMDEAVWDSQIDHNLKSVFLTCKHVLPHMLTQGSGSIINLSSTSGIRWTGSAQVAYAATKAGVIQLSRVLAVQYAKQGIRVNSIVPGQLHTPMVEVRLAGQRTGGDVEALLRQRQSRIPLPFMGDGRDTAHAALYLASDESRFVTGTELVIDGGMSVRCD
jgi:NAD(P)-dependent dehydrogenase (short-subunit alcohol dehydrogenase family)